MRALSFLVMTLWFGIASSAPIPDLVCQELHVIHVDPRTLRTQEYESGTIYRFKSEQLYLSSPDRAEYLYNNVVEIEPMRYLSGHKTLQFEAADFRTAIFVHSYRDEVRVSRARCTRS